MDPKVSVIIPVYNVEKYIRQCLDSIVNQTLKEIEIICVDDGSTDSSLDILKEYAEKDERIIILQQKNQYAGVARNNGVKIAKGKCLSFLDSDDFFELNMLEKMYTKIEEDSSDIVICGWNVYNNKTKSIIKNHKMEKRYLDISPFNPEDVADKLFGICKPNPWTKMFNRQFFVENKLEFEDCICCNDLTCICTALCIARKISVVEDILIHYRMFQENNLTANRKDHLDAVIQSINKLEENMKKFNVFEKFNKTFLKKAVGSFDYAVKECSKDELISRKELAKKYLVDDAYFAIYKEIKPRVSEIVCKDKFF